MTLAPMIAQVAEQLEMRQRISIVPLLALQAAERCQVYLTPTIQLIEELNRKEEMMKRLAEGTIKQALNFINPSTIDLPIFKEPELKLLSFAETNPCDEGVAYDQDEEQKPPRRLIGFRFPPNN